MAAGKKAKGKKAQQKEGESRGGEDLIYVSPSRVRFQHSKIRPFFSGCGRSVTETLDEIRSGKIEPADLPPIQVLIGPDDENDDLGPWYFSLNNRRLWVLKECHKEGLLNNERYNNKIPVRVRDPKSGTEAERYTVESCALEAKFMREGGGGSKKGKNGKGKKGADHESQITKRTEAISLNEQLIRKNDKSNGNESGKRCGSNQGENKASDSESESDDNVAHQSNRFSALL